MDDPARFRTWDEWIGHCDTYENLTESERANAKAAFETLRAELGEDFIGKATDDGHPFLAHILNLAPWSRKWLPFFIGCLKRFSGADNYHSLIERFRDPRRYREAMSVAKAACIFSEAGFGIRFEPEVVIDGVLKKPDLELTLQTPRQTVFAEVAGFAGSTQSRNAGETAKAITSPLLAAVSALRFSARIEKSLAPRHLEEVAAKVAALVKDVEREKRFVELAIEGVIELAAAPSGNTQTLEEWASERSLSLGNIVGPDFIQQDLLRIERTIKEKEKQLPKDVPGIIFIDTTLIDRYRIKDTISYLEEVVYSCPRVSLVILCGGHMGTVEPLLIQKELHTFIQRTRADLVVEQYLVLLNRFGDNILSEEIVARLLNAIQTG